MAAAVTDRPSATRIVIVEPNQASRLPGDEAVRVDAAATAVEWLSPGRAAVDDRDGRRRTAQVGVDRPAGPRQRRTVEVVVDGWRFELEVEDARRAELRTRATRNRAATGETDGPLEIRAIIPGRVVAVAVAPGDAVAVGQTLLLVEAMKMQNEVKATRDGVVAEVRVAVGDTVNAGQLLAVVD